MKTLKLLGVAVVMVAVLMLLALIPGMSFANGVGPGPSDVVTVTVGGLPPFVFTYPESMEIPVLLPLGLPFGSPLPGPIPGLPSAVVFVEPAFEPCSVPRVECISDILFLDGIGNLLFVSDDDVTALEAILASLPVMATFILETGLPQDVTGLLLIDPLFPVRITVQSDVAPEPSTILLLGSGLAGLVAWKRRQSKNA